MMENMVNRCHHPPNRSMVFEMEGVKYFATDMYNIMDFHGDLVVNLSGLQNVPRTDEYSSKLSKHYDLPFKEIMVPWPDFGSPMVKMSFWRALHDFIRSKKYKRVCIQCGHGHGRTGTALASIMIANAGFKPIVASNWVRENHCAQAIESQEQCEYLMKIYEYHNPDEELSVEDCPFPSAYFAFGNESGL